LASFITMQCLCWWAWLARELPPLERYYLPAYFHSSEGAKRVSSRTRFEPLFKTAPGRKRELIFTSDVVSGGDANLPLQLSQAALEQGWIGIERGSAIWDNSDAVEDFLRDDFYLGRGFRQLAAEPLLYSCPFLLVSMVSALFIRKELIAEWRDLWTAMADSQSPLDYRFDSPAHEAGIMTGIGLRREPLKWIGRLRSRLVDPTLQAGRNIAGPRDRLDPSGSGPELASARVQPTASQPLQRADSGPQGKLMKPAGSGSKRPAERRRIFPGKADVRNSNQTPKAWDESRWID
jgi:hypothetical protein